MKSVSFWCLFHGGEKFSPGLHLCQQEVMCAGVAVERQCKPTARVYKCLVEKSGLFLVLQCGVSLILELPWPHELHEVIFVWDNNSVAHSVWALSSKSFTVKCTLKERTGRRSGQNGVMSCLVLCSTGTVYCRLSDLAVKIMDGLRDVKVAPPPSTGIIKNNNNQMIPLL